MDKEAQTWTKSCTVSRTGSDSAPCKQNEQGKLRFNSCTACFIKRRDRFKQEGKFKWPAWALELLICLNHIFQPHKLSRSKINWRSACIRITWRSCQSRACCLSAPLWFSRCKNVHLTGGRRDCCAHLENPEDKEGMHLWIPEILSSSNKTTWWLLCLRSCEGLWYWTN